MVTATTGVRGTRGAARAGRCNSQRTHYAAFNASVSALQVPHISERRNKGLAEQVAPLNSFFQPPQPSPAPNSPYAKVIALKQRRRVLIGNRVPRTNLFCGREAEGAYSTL